MESWLLPLTIGMVAAAVPFAWRWMRGADGEVRRETLEERLPQASSDADRALVAQFRLIRPDVRAAVWRAALFDWFTPALLAAANDDLKRDGFLWRLLRREPAPGPRTRDQLAMLKQLPFVDSLAPDEMTLTAATRRRLRDELWDGEPALYRSIARRAGRFAVGKSGDYRWAIAAVSLLLQGQDPDAEEMAQLLGQAWQQERATGQLLALTRTLQPEIAAGRIDGDGAGWIHLWDALLERQEGRYAAALAALQAALAAQSHSRRLAGMIQQSLGEILTLPGVTDFKAASRCYRDGRATWRDLGIPYREAECLLGAADAERLAGRYDVAQRHLTEAEAIYRRLKAPGGLVLVGRGLGDVALDTGRYDDAQRHFTTALEACQARHDDLGVGSLLQRLAFLAAERGEPRAARAAYHEAADAFSRCGEEQLAAACRMGSGHTALDRNGSDLSSAQIDYESALDLYNRLGDQMGRSDAAYALGTVAFRSGDHERALWHFREARNVARRLDDPQAECRCLTGMARTAQCMRDYERAEHWLASARTLAEAEKDGALLVECHYATAQLLLMRYAFASAGAQVRDGLHLARQRADNEAIAEGLLLQGAVCEGREQFDEAGHHYAAALALFDREYQPRRSGICHIALGNLALLRDAYATASSQVEAATACFAADNSPWGQAAALRLRGELQLATGAFDAAYETLSLAEAQFLALPEPGSAAYCRLKRAFGLLEQGKAPEAADLYHSLMATLEALDDPLGVASAQHGLGEALAAQGRLDEARAAFEQAAGLFSQVGSRWGMTRCARGLAGVQRRNGAAQEAVETYRPVLAYFRRHGAREEVGRTLHGLGLALRQLGAHAAAGEALGEAHDLLSTLGVPYAARVAGDLQLDKTLRQ